MRLVEAIDRGEGRDDGIVSRRSHFHFEFTRRRNGGKKTKEDSYPTRVGKHHRSKEEEGGVGSKVADKEESWDRLGYGLATASTYVVKRVRLHSQVARNQVVSR